MNDPILKTDLIKMNLRDVFKTDFFFVDTEMKAYYDAILKAGGKDEQDEICTLIIENCDMLKEKTSNNEATFPNLEWSRARAETKNVCLKTIEEIGGGPEPTTVKAGKKLGNIIRSRKKTIDKCAILYWFLKDIGE